MYEILLVVFGLFGALVIDVYWWNQTRFKKVDVKLKAHEHYHISLELVIVSIILYSFLETAVSYLLVGLAIGFFLGENLTVEDC